MKKIITIRKSNDKVESISNSTNIINSNLFDQKEITVSQEDLNNIDNSFEVFYKNEKLVFVKSLDKDKKEKLDLIMDILKNPDTDLEKTKKQIIDLILLIK